MRTLAAILISLALPMPAIAGDLDGEALIKAYTKPLPLGDPPDSLLRAWVTLQEREKKHSIEESKLWYYAYGLSERVHKLECEIARIEQRPCN
jgi:hypothetical protein